MRFRHRVSVIADDSASFRPPLFEIQSFPLIADDSTSFRPPLFKNHCLMLVDGLVVLGGAVHGVAS